jgi:hypothetical protein
MAPIMALNPVIRANAKTEPDQTCFGFVVGEKSENQSISRIVTIAHLTREREREEKECAARGADADDEKGQKPSSREEYRATKAVSFPRLFASSRKREFQFQIGINEHINTRVVSYLTVKRL